MKGKQIKKKILIVFLTIVTLSILLGIFDLLYYERHFISNESKTKYITVWKRWGGECYLIKDKYWSILPPKNNYLISYNSARLIIVWNPDNAKDKISLYLGDYYEEKCDDFETYANIYTDRNEFLYKYTGEYYDTSGSIVFNQDSIKYKKNKYEMEYLNIACISKIFKILPCIDH